jgi:hypothetical protein
LPFQLSNAGETITLLSPLNAIISSVPYDDLPPWPVEADGLGYSLVPLFGNPTGNQSDPGQWTRSCLLGGSPGADDPGAPLRLPLWALQPISQETNLGASVTFDVVADACPDAFYQWWRDGEPVDAETGEVLRLPGLNALDHESQFWCVAWNEFGAVTSAVATLRVDYPGRATPLPSLELDFAVRSDGLSLNWLSVSNGVYRVQWSAELAPAEWRNLGPAWFGDGSWFELSITNAVMPRLFYRALHYAQP